MSAKPRSIPRLNSHQDAPGPFSLPASADLNNPHTWLHFSTVLIFALQALANKTRAAGNVWASAHLKDLIPTLQRMNERAVRAAETLSVHVQANGTPPDATAPALVEIKTRGGQRKT